MQKIIPFLWFENNAEEAIEFYTSLFEDSEIGRIERYDEMGAEVSGMPKGSVMSIDFKLAGQEFGAINGGPVFKFTPATSLFVNCDSEGEVDNLFEKLSEGGEILMPLQKYPFSEKYAWVSDRFGLSWQINFMSAEQKITPCLMFVGDKNGRAEEAMNFYTSLFEDSNISAVARYEAGEGDVEGNVKHARFALDGFEFIAMESGGPHKFDFTGAVSFLVNCDNQEEVDKFWNAMTAEGQELPCGWLTDKYGVSWQIVPKILNELLQSSDREKAKKAQKAMFKMKKIEIEELVEAFEN